MYKKKLLIIMPVYNEEAALNTVINEWMAELTNQFQQREEFDFLAINDGSKDGSLEVLQKLKQNYKHLIILNKKNSGHGLSCREGYLYAQENQYEFVFQIDSDGQCDPQYFKSFWENRLTYPIQFGQRRNRDDGISRLIISKILSIYLFIFTLTFLRDANVPYRLMKTVLLKEILPLIPPHFDLYNVALSLKIQQKLGIKWNTIHFRNRIGGTASLKTWKFAAAAIKLLKDLYIK